MWNFNTQNKGLNYNKKSIGISFDIIYAPEHYVRYFAKIQRMLSNRILQVAYIPFAWLLFHYVWSIAVLKDKLN